MNEGIQVYDIGEIDLVSINQKFCVNAHTRRLFISPKYRAAKIKLISALSKIKAKNEYVIMGNCRVYLKVTCYDDIDAFCKCILDSLQAAEVIENDRNVLEMHVIKVPVKRNEKKQLYIAIEDL